jgi:transcriptional/translational regulatory protein YebC/TACO1
MGRAYQNRKDSMAKTSDMKARIYSRHARELYVSAKSGGVDPEGNLSLRGLIERAKRNQVPAHVIEKALDKAPVLYQSKMQVGVTRQRQPFV